MRKNETSFFLLVLVLQTVFALPPPPSPHNHEQHPHENDVAGSQATLEQRIRTSLNDQFDHSPLIEENNVIGQQDLDLFLSTANETGPSLFTLDDLKLKRKGSIPIFSPIEVFQVTQEEIRGPRRKPNSSRRSRIPKPTLLRASDRPVEDTSSVGTFRSLSDRIQRQRDSPSPQKVIFQRVPVVIEIVDKTSEGNVAIAPSLDDKVNQFNEDLIPQKSPEAEKVVDSQIEPHRFNAHDTQKLDNTQENSPHLFMEEELASTTLSPVDDVTITNLELMELEDLLLGDDAPGEETTIKLEEKVEVTTNSGMHVEVTTDFPTETDLGKAELGGTFSQGTDQMVPESRTHQPKLMTSTEPSVEEQVPTEETEIVQEIFEVVTSTSVETHHVPIQTTSSQVRDLDTKNETKNSEQNTAKGSVADKSSVVATPGVRRRVRPRNQAERRFTPRRRLASRRPTFRRRNKERTQKQTENHAQTKEQISALETTQKKTNENKKETPSLFMLLQQSNKSNNLPKKKNKQPDTFDAALLTNQGRSIDSKNVRAQTHRRRNRLNGRRRNQKDEQAKRRFAQNLKRRQQIAPKPDVSLFVFEGSENSSEPVSVDNGLPPGFTIVSSHRTVSVSSSSSDGEQVKLIENESPEKLKIIESLISKSKPSADDITEESEIPVTGDTVVGADGIGSDITLNETQTELQEKQEGIIATTISTLMNLVSLVTERPEPLSMPETTVESQIDDTTIKSEIAREELEPDLNTTEIDTAQVDPQKIVTSQPVMEQIPMEIATDIPDYPDEVLPETTEMPSTPKTSTEKIEIILDNTSTSIDQEQSNDTELSIKTTDEVNIDMALIESPLDSADLKAIEEELHALASPVNLDDKKHNIVDELPTHLSDQELVADIVAGLDGILSELDVPATEIPMETTVSPEILLGDLDGISSPQAVEVQVTTLNPETENIDVMEEVPTASSKDKPISGLFEATVIAKSFDAKSPVENLPAKSIIPVEEKLVPISPVTKQDKTVEEELVHDILLSPDMESIVEELDYINTASLDFESIDQPDLPVRETVEPQANQTETVKQETFMQPNLTKIDASEDIAIDQLVEVRAQKISTMDDIPVVIQENKMTDVKELEHHINPEIKVDEMNLQNSLVTQIIEEIVEEPFIIKNIEPKMENIESKIADIIENTVTTETNVHVVKAGDSISKSTAEPKMNTETFLDRNMADVREENIIILKQSSPPIEEMGPLLRELETSQASVVPKLESVVDDQKSQSVTILDMSPKISTTHHETISPTNQQPVPVRKQEENIEELPMEKMDKKDIILQQTSPSIEGDLDSIQEQDVSSVAEVLTSEGVLADQHLFKTKQEHISTDKRKEAVSLEPSNEAVSINKVEISSDITNESIIIIKEADTPIHTLDHLQDSSPQMEEVLSLQSSKTKEFKTAGEEPTQSNKIGKSIDGTKSSLSSAQVIGVTDKKLELEKVSNAQSDLVQIIPTPETLSDLREDPELGVMIKNMMEPKPFEHTKDIESKNVVEISNAEKHTDENNVPHAPLSDIMPELSVFIFTGHPVSDVSFVKGVDKKPAVISSTESSITKAAEIIYETSSLASDVPLEITMETSEKNMKAPTTQTPTTTAPTTTTTTTQTTKTSTTTTPTTIPTIKTSTTTPVTTAPTTKTSKTPTTIPSTTEKTSTTSATTTKSSMSIIKVSKETILTEVIDAESMKKFEHDSQTQAVVTDPVVFLTEDPINIEERPISVTEAPIHVTKSHILASDATVPHTEIPLSIAEAPSHTTESSDQITEAPIPVTGTDIVDNEVYSSTTKPKTSTTETPVQLEKDIPVETSTVVHDDVNESTTTSKVDTVSGIDGSTTTTQAPAISEVQDSSLITTKSTTSSSISEIPEVIKTLEVIEEMSESQRPTIQVSQSTEPQQPITSTPKVEETMVSDVTRDEISFTKDPSPLSTETPSILEPFEDLTSQDLLDLLSIDEISPELQDLILKAADEIEATTLKSTALLVEETTVTTALLEENINLLHDSVPETTESAKTSELEVTTVNIDQVLEIESPDSPPVQKLDDLLTKGFNEILVETESILSGDKKENEISNDINLGKSIDSSKSLPLSEQTLVSEDGHDSENGKFSDKTTETSTEKSLEQSPGIESEFSTESSQQPSSDMPEELTTESLTDIEIESTTSIGTTTTSTTTQTTKIEITAPVTEAQSPETVDASTEPEKIATATINHVPETTESIVEVEQTESFDEETTMSPFEPSTEKSGIDIEQFTADLIQSELPVVFETLLKQRIDAMPKKDGIDKSPASSTQGKSLSDSAVVDETVVGMEDDKSVPEMTQELLTTSTEKSQQVKTTEKKEEQSFVKTKDTQIDMIEVVSKSEMPKKMSDMVTKAATAVKAQMAEALSTASEAGGIAESHESIVQRLLEELLKSIVLEKLRDPSIDKLIDHHVKSAVSFPKNVESASSIKIKEEPSSQKIPLEPITNVQTKEIPLDHPKIPSKKTNENIKDVIVTSEDFKTMENEMVVGDSEVLHKVAEITPSSGVSSQLEKLEVKHEVKLSSVVDEKDSPMSEQSDNSSDTSPITSLQTESDIVQQNVEKAEMSLVIDTEVIAKMPNSVLQATTQDIDGPMQVSLHTTEKENPIILHIDNRIGKSLLDILSPKQQELTVSTKEKISDQEIVQIMPIKSHQDSTPATVESTIDELEQILEVEITTATPVGSNFQTAHVLDEFSTADELPRLVEPVTEQSIMEEVSTPSQIDHEVRTLTPLLSAFEIQEPDTTLSPVIERLQSLLVTEPLVEQVREVTEIPDLTEISPALESITSPLEAFFVDHAPTAQPQKVFHEASQDIDTQKEMPILQDTPNKLAEEDMKIKIIGDDTIPGLVEKVVKVTKIDSKITIEHDVTPTAFETNPTTESTTMASQAPIIIKNITDEPISEPSTTTRSTSGSSTPSTTESPPTVIYTTHSTTIASAKPRSESPTTQATTEKSSPVSRSSPKVIPVTPTTIESIATTTKPPTITKESAATTPASPTPPRASKHTTTKKEPAAVTSASSTSPPTSTTPHSAVTTSASSTFSDTTNKSSTITGHSSSTSTVSFKSQTTPTPFVVTTPDTFRAPIAETLFQSSQRQQTQPHLFRPLQQAPTPAPSESPFGKSLFAPAPPRTQSTHSFFGSSSPFQFAPRPSPGLSLSFAVGKNAPPAHALSHFGLAPRPSNTASSTTGHRNKVVSLASPSGSMLFLRPNQAQHFVSQGFGVPLHNRRQFTQFG